MSTTEHSHSGGDDVERIGPNSGKPHGVLEIIGKLQSRQIKHSDINHQDLLLCVQHLMADGFNVPEIARVVGVEDRTVRRYRREIRESQILEPDPKLPRQIAGSLMAEADTCIDRIRRATRGADVAPAEKVLGERACYSIRCEMVERLQSLGFLPKVAQKLEADFAHTFQVGFDWKALATDLEHMICVGQTVGDAQLSDKAKKFLQQIAQARLDEGVKQLTDQLSNQKVGDSHGN